MTAATARIDLVLASRSRQRLAGAAAAAAVAAVAAWCLHDVVIADTDWSRIGGALGFLAALQRFFRTRSRPRAPAP